MLETISHGPVRELRLARPPANALSPELVTRLKREVEAAPGQGAEALVLSGAPGMFSAGLDVPVMLGLDRMAIRAAWRGFLELLQALGRSPVPLAAAITGHSPAGGAVLAIFCDYRVMAEGSFKIGLNEVQVGIPLPPEFVAVLARVVGGRRAEHLTVGGRMVESAEAARLGFVDRLEPVGGVVPAAVAWCRELLALPRRAMSVTRASNRADLVALCDRLTGERLIDDIVEAWFSDETQAALRAMVARVTGKSG